MKKMILILAIATLSSCGFQGKHYVSVPKRYKPQIDSLLVVNKAIFFNVSNIENCVSVEVTKRNKEVITYNLK